MPLSIANKPLTSSAMRGTISALRAGDDRNATPRRSRGRGRRWPGRILVFIHLAAEPRQYRGAERHDSRQGPHDAIADHLHVRRQRRHGGVEVTLVLRLARVGDVDDLIVRGGATWRP